MRVKPFTGGDAAAASAVGVGMADMNPAVQAKVEMRMETARQRNRGQGQGLHQNRSGRTFPSSSVFLLSRAFCFPGWTLYLKSCRHGQHFKALIASCGRSQYFNQSINQPRGLNQCLHQQEALPGIRMFGQGQQCFLSSGSRGNRSAPFTSQRSSLSSNTRASLISSAWYPSGSSTR